MCVSMARFSCVPEPSRVYARSFGAIAMMNWTNRNFSARPEKIKISLKLEHYQLRTSLYGVFLPWKAARLAPNPCLALLIMILWVWLSALRKSFQIAAVLLLHTPPNARPLAPTVEARCA
jgi:hypothetical protein